VIAHDSKNGEQYALSDMTPDQILTNLAVARAEARAKYVEVN
jgi:hypothetical protein